MDLINKWKDKITHYADVRIKLAKLSLIEGTSAAMSYFILIIISMFLLFCILLFMGLGLAEWFSVLADSHVAGYFITLGVYVFLLILFMMLRKSITKGFSNTFIRIFTAAGADKDKKE